MPAQTSKTTPLFLLFPSVSFFAELVTEKKSAKLQNVTKIDFPLIKDGKFLTEELEEALSKLEQKTLNLVVSDEIFHHHIADLPAKADESLEEQVAKTVSTAFPDEHEPLHIVTLDLAKTKKIHTVQISAITKDNLSRLQTAAQKSGVTIKTIIPASFSVKAFVSIDPSLFILRTTDSLLLTSHYIGVEYAKKIDNNDLEELVKSIAELKKTHPHLQHAYVSAEDSEAENIESAIKETIPTQNITTPKVEAEDDTPNMVKILALGYRDVIENKFPYPLFSLKTVTSQPNLSPDSTKENSVPKTTASSKNDDSTLPKPDAPKMEETPKADEKKVEPVKKTEESSKELNTSDESSEKSTAASAPITAPKVESAVSPTPKISPVISPTTAPTLAPAGVSPEGKPKEDAKATPIVAPIESKETKKGKGIGSYIIIAVVVALVIGLVGGGIIISRQAMSDYGKDAGSPQPEEVMAEPTPAPTSTPEPTVTPIAKAELSILVVNATKIAGHAGATATALTDAGYDDPDTGNAKGDYDAGTFIMIKDEEQVALVDQFKTDLELEKLEKIAFDETEDPSDQYDVVIVLAE